MMGKLRIEDAAMNQRPMIASVTSPLAREHGVGDALLSTCCFHS